MRRGRVGAIFCKRFGNKYLGIRWLFQSRLLTYDAEGDSVFRGAASVPSDERVRTRVVRVGFGNYQAAVRVVAVDRHPGVRQNRL